LRNSHQNQNSSQAKTPFLHEVFILLKKISAMNQNHSRRKFLQTTALAGTALLIPDTLWASKSSQKILAYNYILSVTT